MSHRTFTLIKFEPNICSAASSPTALPVPGVTIVDTTTLWHSPARAGAWAERAPALPRLDSFSQWLEGQLRAASAGTEFADRPSTGYRPAFGG